MSGLGLISRATSSKFSSFFPVTLAKAILYYFGKAGKDEAQNMALVRKHIFIERATVFYWF